MQNLFPITIFLYMLGLLLGLAGLGGRPEFKAAGRASHVSYLLASAMALAILVSLPGDGPLRFVSSFFGGALLALLVLAVAYLVIFFTHRVAGASAIFSFCSLPLGVMALFRIHAVAGIDVERALGGHVACLFIALAGFTLSFMLSAVFLIQERLIKSRRLGALFLALPPLELVSRANFASLSVGTAAFAMGVVGGIAALRRSPDSSMSLADPVFVLSILMLGFYAVLILLRRGPMERARTLSVASLLFYPLLIFVFWGAHATP